MNGEIKYFMWDHQRNTQHRIQCYAEELFARISPKLDPRTFFLGVLRKKRDDRLPICVEPEECGVNVKIFEGVDALAKSIWETDRRRNIWDSDPDYCARYQYNVKRDSVCMAVQQLLDQNLNQNSISFVSKSVDFEDYEVFVVLQFNRQVYESRYSLRPNTHPPKSAYGTFYKLRPIPPGHQSFLNRSYSESWG